MAPARATGKVVLHHLDAFFPSEAEGVIGTEEGNDRSANCQSGMDGERVRTDQDSGLLYQSNRIL